MGSSKERTVIGRRHLLVLGAAAAVVPACSGTGAPLGGPYGGEGNLPGPTSGSVGSGGSSGGTGGSGGSGGGSGSGSTGGSSGTGSGSGSSNSSGSSGSGSSSGTGSSSGSSGSSSGTGSSSGSASGSGSSSGGVPACTTNGSNTLSLPFSQYPQLKQPGGSAAVQANGYSDPNCGASDIIVFQNSAGQYVALSAGCNHVCCTAGFNGSDIRCPCHGATWDLTGKLTRGPATANLQSLSVCSDASGVYVTW